MSGKPCPVCQAETYDGLVCRDCIRRLRCDLEHLPRNWRVLDDVLAGVKGNPDGRAVAGGTSPSRESSLPYNQRASKVRTYVWNQITTWIRELDLGDTKGLAPNMRACCNWLLARLERIRGHAAADELVAELRYCAGLVRRAIDLPPDLDLIGACEVCGTTMHAYPGAAEATCRECRAVVNATAKRAELAARVENELVPRTSVLRVIATVYGREVNHATFRGWIHDERLVKAGDDESGRPLYRVGDVMELAKALGEAT